MQLSTLFSLLMPILVTGCALQSSYAPPPLQAPASWSTSGTFPDDMTRGDAVATTETWWTTLKDPAIDALIPKALSESPTLAQAVARIDEARAMVGTTSAQRLPAISLEAGGGRDRGLGSGGSATEISRSANAGLRVGWEVDLFGRISQSVDAANSRLDARTADARSARLALTAQIVHGVAGLRSCKFSTQVQMEDIASREKVLDLVRQRLAAGAVPRVEEARAAGSLASARTRFISQREQCEKQTNALTRLTGMNRDGISGLLAASPSVTPRMLGTEIFMPQAPLLAIGLPADVLAAHPDIVAADREAAAAWAEIGVARANRMPRIDLAGLLSRNWLSAAGTSMTYSTWSLAASLTAPLFDGGLGVAQVDASIARYRGAEAGLRDAVLLAARDVEDALAGSASAQQRATTSRDSLDAAVVTLTAVQAQWEAGAVSLFELEDARRQMVAAEDAVITASRDGVQAWVAIIQASGNTALVSKTTSEINASALSHE
ncbi:efflux transporter outer membrane subunit [Acidovorax sp. NCPPB 3576]|uniref:efflux transporter outer membrane subunit n=1 Tax=Acidovorax sp. NCPPB 3576 TaxID=2940488 RepID=UPI00234A0FB6|nr:efflux transporter outer membrane subunit [Acidovorax sp. NCPPB 3576]WCM90492.1 efflux transporter outer membrane subunit [Acidovorax sp. NCPPB 3576]